MTRAKDADRLAEHVQLGDVVAFIWSDLSDSGVENGMDEGDLQRPN